MYYECLSKIMKVFIKNNLSILGDLKNYLIFASLLKEGTNILDKKIIFSENNFTIIGSSNKNYYVCIAFERRHKYIRQKLDSVAQLVEHLTFNQGVLGSNPSWITSKN